MAPQDADGSAGSSVRIPDSDQASIERNSSSEGKARFKYIPDAIIVGTKLTLNSPKDYDAWGDAVLC